LHPVLQTKEKLIKINMKKLVNYMLSMLAIAGMLFLSSCGDDEEDPAPKGATISLIASDSSISGDVELTVGSSFGIIVNATKGDRNMDKWSITRDGIALADYDGLEVPDNSNFTAPISPIGVPLTAGVYTYAFEVVDNGGVKTSISWVVTASDAASFTEFTNKQLGGQSNASFGSFFKAADGTILLLAAANASNGADVDFFYYNGATNGSTLFSPTDPDAGSLFGGAVDAWTTKNATKIAKSTLDYATASPADVSAATISGTKANQLASGDVVIFETASGIKGILEVSSIAAGNDGSITFNAKVVN
jgi:hypothetical protein